MNSNATKSCSVWTRVLDTARDADVPRDVLLTLIYLHTTAKRIKSHPAVDLGKSEKYSTSRKCLWMDNAHSLTTCLTNHVWLDTLMMKQHSSRFLLYSPL